MRQRCDIEIFFYNSNPTLAKIDSNEARLVPTSAANEHDITIAPSLIREDDEVVYGDAADLLQLVPKRKAAQCTVAGHYAAY